MLRTVTLLTAAIASVTPLSTVKAQQPVETFTVCEGEFPERCPTSPQHEAFTPCGTINGWAQQACRIQNSPEVPKYQLVPLLSVSGNRCGYGIFKVICVR
jgi:hypothetical protein